MSSIITVDTRNPEIAAQQLLKWAKSETTVTPVKRIAQNLGFKVEVKRFERSKTLGIYKISRANRELHGSKMVMQVSPMISPTQQKFIIARLLWLYLRNHADASNGMNMISANSKCGKDLTFAYELLIPKRTVLDFCALNNVTDKDIRMLTKQFELDEESVTNRISFLRGGIQGEKVE